MPPPAKPYTVTAITRIIKGTLEESFDDLWVEGEISNYHHHTSGHRYLMLKDDRAVIKVTIWRSVGATLKFEPENGQKVVVHGNLTIYERAGNYQLNCRQIVPVGIGELELAFRQLFEKLSSEGLFDEENKRPLPEYPQRIGVVTSPTGAALRDIMQIARRRNPTVQLVVYPAQVQGKGAEDTLVAGIDYFNQAGNVDLIIIGRGGGSLEDLWSFNEEKTVRAVAASKLPVISAVGHEIDTTLSDLAADLRAPTPSAAAEIAVWSREELLEELNHYFRRLTSQLSTIIDQGRQALKALTKRPVLSRPLQTIYDRSQYFDNISRLFYSSGKNIFVTFRSRLSLALAKLETLSPVAVLKRGYSVTRRRTDNLVLTSASQIAEGDIIETQVADGTFLSEIRNK